MKVPFIWLAAILVPFLVSCSHTGGISKIPSKTKLAFNQPAKSGAPSPQPGNTGDEDGVFHIVGRKESLKHICSVYSLDLAKVAQINKLKPPYKLNSGDTIFLPISAMLEQEFDKPKEETTEKHRNKTAHRSRNSRLNKLALKGVRNKAVPTLKFPLCGGVLSSPFGHRRGVFHKGLDIAAPIGTPVVACASGRVIFRGICKKFPNYGNIILLKHRNNVYTHYAHLNKMSVKKGQKVRRGQKIGTVGNTGRSTGPHLHLEVRVKHQLYNPLAYFSRNELRQMHITKRFRNSPMGPVKSRWRIPEIQTARRR